MIRINVSRNVSALVVIACALVSSPASASVGKARISRSAPSSFNQFTQNPSAAQAQWMRDHYTRLMVFTPYFDTRLSWFPNAWFYKDLYAIYVGSSFANAHPDWVLRDSAGRNLYIRFDCSGGTCPQYAGDIGNPAFRSDWIATAGAVFAKGYRGIFIDDVNMRIDRISNGNGTSVLPIDPRTGTTMTETNWRRYMAEFTEQIRAAFPGKEIVHNALWFVPTSDPYVQRQLLAADVFGMERGVNDSGIVRGTGPFGFETFLGVIEWMHQRGRAVWFIPSATNDAGREYGLAAHLLMNTGADYAGNSTGAEPNNWWPGWDIDLGAPLGARTTITGGVFQREFSGGRVLVNQPGSSQVTVPLGGAYLTVNGSTVTSVTLGAAQGAVLRRVGATTTSSTSSSTSTTRASTSTTRPTTTSTSTSTTRPSTSTTRASTSTTRLTTSSTSTSSSTTRPSTSTTRASTSTTRPTTSSTQTTTSTTRPSTSTTRVSTSTTQAPTTTTLVGCSQGSPDVDADGMRDTCDPCANANPTVQERTRLSLTKLEAPVNDDRLKFKGSFLNMPTSPAIDPVANGVRFLVVDGRGYAPIDVTIEGGAYDTSTGAGWKISGTGRAWTYKNSGRATPPPNGIEKVKLQLVGDSPAKVRFSVKGKNGHYPIDAADLPLTGTLVVNRVAGTGQCGEARFPLAPPALPSCTVASNGSTISCR